MKIKLLILAGLLLIFVNETKAQALYNNGVNIKLTKGITVFVDGSVQNETGNIDVDAISGNSELLVQSDFINNDTAGGDGYYRVLGNWTNNANFQAGTGTVFLEGANQTLGGSMPTTFNNLTLNGSGVKTQAIDQYCTGILSLNDIELNTDIYSFFVQNPDVSAITLGTGFVSSLNGGFLSRVTNTANAYLFPVGSSVGTTRYRPVELTPDGTGNTYTVRMANTDATSEGYHLDSLGVGICEVNPLFYHQIDRTAGTSAVNMSIYYDDAADGSWEGLVNWTTGQTQWDIIAGSTTVGVYGESDQGDAGKFIATRDSTDDYGVYGECANTDWYGYGGYFKGGYKGVKGKVSPTGSDNYYGVEGYVSGGSGTNYGVKGYAYGSGINYGIKGYAYGSGTNYGVFGIVNDSVGFGVYAHNENTSGTGLIARGNNVTGAYLAGGSGTAGKGTTVGVYGTASDAGGTGIFGRVDIDDGFGVEARNDNATGTALFAAGNNSAGTYLTGGTGAAFTGTDGALSFSDNATGTGLIGTGNNMSSFIMTLTNGSGLAGNSNNVGVYGIADTTSASVGVYGTSDATNGTGVFGVNTQLDDDAVGVYGQVGDGTAASIDPVAVMGYSNVTDDFYGYGGYFVGEWRSIYAENPTTTEGLAGYFSGDIEVTGDISGGTKNFVIDNPEKPAEEILRHTSIESDEAMVVYRGKVKLSDSGEAVVEMPSYFKALTKENEATVQITCVGQPFNIGYEWNTDYNSFIAYGDANREVSWMVMADRDDPYMQENRKAVITKKDGGDKGYKPGYYIHPELYGQSKEKSYNYLWHKKGKTLPHGLKETETRDLQKVSGETLRLKQENTDDTKAPKIKEREK